MSRHARLISGTGYYHVIIRGVSKQILFEDESDYRYFLRRLEKYSEETSVKVCAFCLMTNHVHLLIHDTCGSVSLMMKKIGISFSSYFNNKYERVGHLLQDRYLSEPIGNDGQYCIVLRYILNNPFKAGICVPEKYKWSSYHDFGKRGSFVDTSLAEELFVDKRGFEEYIKTPNDDECLEYMGARRSDEWAKDVIRDTLGIKSGTTLREYDKEQRNEAIRILRSKGVTIKQIERLTGISKGVIQKVKI